MRIKLHIIVLLLLCATACQNTEQIAKEEAEKQKTEQAKQRLDAEKTQAQASCNSFVENEYAGWTLEGSDLDLAEVDIYSSIPFYVHLRKGSKTKVVRLILRTFTKTDSSKYWAVYKPSALELGNIELETEKDRSYESGQESSH